MIRVKNNENVSVAVKVVDLQNTTAMCFIAHCSHCVVKRCRA